MRSDSETDKAEAKFQQQVFDETRRVDWVERDFSFITERIKLFLLIYENRCILVRIMPLRRRNGC